MGGGADLNVPDPAVRTALSADHPITEPHQDMFGFDPFARAIAASIAALRNPEGLVIGIHGPWGSGKSSAVNLIKYHLGSGVLAGTAGLTRIEFNPWWFNGADSLALGFFRELVH
jgi:predicted KAP-like P-loop ATPase